MKLKYKNREGKTFILNCEYNIDLKTLSGINIHLENLITIERRSNPSVLFLKKKDESVVVIPFLNIDHYTSKENIISRTEVSEEIYNNKENKYLPISTTKAWNDNRSI
jgi:hypothetical protein